MHAYSYCLNEFLDHIKINVRNNMIRNVLRMKYSLDMDIKLFEQTCIELTKNNKCFHILMCHSIISNGEL